MNKDEATLQINPDSSESVEQTGSSSPHSASWQFVALQKIQTVTNRKNHLLSLEQQPIQSRMCGFGERVDRRPVDPPPVVRLSVKNEKNQDDESYLYNPYYFMYASLLKNDTEEEIHVLKDGRTKATTGSIVSSLFRLKDLDRKDGAFFVFPDLSVRMEGIYKLKFSLFEIVGTEMHFCASLVTAPFIVYSAKKFPGMRESTALSRSFADQGLKIRIRKDSRAKNPRLKREASASSIDLRSKKRAATQESDESSVESKDTPVNNQPKATTYFDPSVPADNQPYLYPVGQSKFWGSPYPPPHSGIPGSYEHLNYGNRNVTRHSVDRPQIVQQIHTDSYNPHFQQPVYYENGYNGQWSRQEYPQYPQQQQQYSRQPQYYQGPPQYQQDSQYFQGPRYQQVRYYQEPQQQMNHYRDPRAAEYRNQPQQMQQAPQQMPQQMSQQYQQRSQYTYQYAQPSQALPHFDQLGNYYQHSHDQRAQEQRPAENEQGAPAASAPLVKKEDNQ